MKTKFTRIDISTDSPVHYQYAPDVVKIVREYEKKFLDKTKEV